MKQHLETVESSNAGTYERDVNQLLKEGYKIKSTNICNKDDGSYDAYSLYQAILVKDIIEELVPDEELSKQVNISEKELYKITKLEDKELEELINDKNS